MSRIYRPLAVFLALLLVVHCGVFEPEYQCGSINIQLINETENLELKKALESLSAVQCILKKGTSSVHDQYYNKTGGVFQITINELDPADNYSILIYGKNSSGEIIGRGYQDGIIVRAGETTNASISWDKFKPILTTPTDGSTSDDSTPAFDWGDVSNAMMYELKVDNSASFNSPEISTSDIPSSSYNSTIELANGVYYWKVRCKDTQGNWGGWSEPWNFTISINTVATPAFNPLPGTYATAQDVIISCSTSGAAIHFTTNGSDPTESDPTIGSGSSVHISSTTTLKARAYKSGWTHSAICSGIYTITGSVATPTFNPLPGTFSTAQDVTISCSTLGTTIHYTTNGSDPTESDPTIGSGSTVHITSTTTLKARAYKSGWTASMICSGTYTITGSVATPTFDPLPGNYTTAQDVTISCSTSGAAIHYTTNSSDPTESDPAISSGSSVHISSTTTLKARAYKTGWTTSDACSGTYTITGSVSTPAFNPLPGTYATAQSVTITCSTSGATVYYTTNGSDPTESDQSISSGTSVTISSTTNLKARAYKNNWISSAVASGLYTISTNSSLIAYYPFNRNVNDESGNNYNGITTNVSFVSDRFGNNQSAISLNGDGYVNLGDIFNETYVPVSISAWINCKGVNITETIFGSDVPISDGIWGGFDFKVTRMDGNGSTIYDYYLLNFEFSKNTGSVYEGRKTRQSNINCPVNQWVHVVGIIKNFSDMDLFINNQSVGGLYSGGAESMSHNVSSALIGPWFHGAIDDLRIYNGILSTQEIDNLYSESSNPSSTVTDIDGNIYHTIKIGDQVWMAENLKVTHYRNGDTIPNITVDNDWGNLITHAYCNFNNDENNTAVYGRLYNWFTVNDSRIIAPVGWHVPSDVEVKTLEMYLGMSQLQADTEGLRGTDEGGKLKETGTTHWLSPNTGATNESGFSALPGGIRNSSGIFDLIGSDAFYWSSTEAQNGSIHQGWYRNLYNNISKVTRGQMGKQAGLSVRCVKD